MTHSARTDFSCLERLAVRIGDDLGNAVVVTEVDEQHAAVVAHAMHPAGQSRRPTDIALPECSAGVRAVAVNRSSVAAGPTGRFRARRARHLILSHLKSLPELFD